MDIRPIAALYVLKDGPYFGLPGVDPWDEERDARLYDGPHPVVAHPPCARWGRYWSGGPSARVRRQLGDDGGCFAAALEAVRRWGGVLEHPEASHAWRAFGLVSPPREGGWVRDLQGAWTCCVEQGAYGHRARKATWLYFVGSDDPPSLRWGPCGQKQRLDDGFHSADERRCAESHQRRKRLTAFECAATPPEFRDLLISLARSVYQGSPARPHGHTHTSFLLLAVGRCRGRPAVWREIGDIMTTSDDVLFLAAVAAWAAMALVGGLALIGIAGGVRILWRHWRQRRAIRRLTRALKWCWPGFEVDRDIECARRQWPGME